MDVALLVDGDMKAQDQSLKMHPDVSDWQFRAVRTGASSQSSSIDWGSGGVWRLCGAWISWVASSIGAPEWHLYRSCDSRGCQSSCIFCKVAVSFRPPLNVVRDQWLVGFRMVVCEGVCVVINIARWSLDFSRFSSAVNSDSFSRGWRRWGRLLSSSTRWLMRIWKSHMAYSWSMLTYYVTVHMYDAK